MQNPDSERQARCQSKVRPITTKLGECKEASTGATMPGVGESSGTILMSGEAHLVWTMTDLGGGLLFYESDSLRCTSS